MTEINKPAEGITEHVASAPMTVRQMIEVLSFANPEAKLVLPIEGHLFSVLKLMLDDDKVYIGLGADINKSVTSKAQFLQGIQDLICDKSMAVRGKHLIVWTENPENSGCEVTWGPAENLQPEYDYYNSAYDDELRLTSNPAVHVVAYALGEKENIIKVV